MIRNTTGLIHTMVACCALLSGLIIFARPKASRFHKILGYVYSLSMAILIVTAFGLYHLTGSFNVLHFAAVSACPPLLLGLRAAVRRQPRTGWLLSHYYWMCWSYVGLCSAFVAEATTRVVMPYVSQHYGLKSPGLFWTVVAVASGLVALPGWYFVERNRHLVARFPPPKA